MNNIEKFSEQILLEMIQEIERKSMPQVKGKNVDEVLKIFDESGIAYEQGQAKCSDLSATQEDFIPEKVESIKKQIQETDWVTHPLFISKEGKILDGHHRWLAYKEIYGDDYSIPVTKVDLPLEQALQTFDDSASEVNEETINQRTIVVFPGRFQPFHSGHYYSYQALKKKFGDVYVATSDKVEPGKSPFNFSEKKQIMKKMFGISTNRIIPVKSPYNANSYEKIGDSTKDVLVIGLGEKDAQRLGGKWYKPYKGNENNLKPFNEHIYTYIVPQLQMKVGGKTISGTQTREVFKKGSDKAKQNLFKKLYGKFDQGIFDLIVNKLNESVILGSTVIEDFVTEVNIKQLLLEVSQAVESEVDDGPATFYKRPDAFVLGQLVNKQKSVSDVIKQLGWQIVDWLAGDNEDIMTLRHKYKTDHVGDVSFGDLGVRDTTYPDPLQKYKNRMEKIATNVGYSLVSWLLSKDNKRNIIDDPKSEMATHEPLVQNTSGNRPLGEQLFSKEWWTKNVMTESPDNVEIKGKNLEYTDRDARAFGYKKEKMLISKFGDTHYSMGLFLKYSGRIWKKNKVISFWEYPSVSKFKKVIQDLEKITKLNIWNDPKWQLDVEKSKAVMGTLIPLKSYIGSGEVKRTKHADSPLIKGKTKVSAGWGSKKIPKDIKPGETMAQYNARQRTSENLDDSKFLLIEGGAYGHLNHPFDDMDLTFGDLKTMIDTALEGKLEMAQEKTDGQNLMISWKNGKLVAARNKSHLKNFGENALNKNGVSDMFAGRGEIQNAFTFAMNDLEKAIGKLSQKQKDKIFQNGKKFMSFEVMYPATQNVIPYGMSMLLFHGTMEYDKEGNVIGGSKEDAKMLAGMIKQINQEVQKNYTIGDVPVLKLPKVQDFSKQKAKFNSKLNTLKNQFKLKDSDLVMLYHQSWWEDFISKQAKKFKYGIPNRVMTNLVKRWAYSDKSYKITDMKKEIDNEKFLSWALDFDKTSHDDQLKKNISPFELLFLELGAQVLKNMNQLLTANPEKAVQQMKKDLEATIKELEATNDVTKMGKLKTQLDRLNAIGGMDTIVPTEGITFMYNGKLYKLTGTFAASNQILGMLKFSR